MQQRAPGRRFGLLGLNIDYATTMSTFFYWAFHYNYYFLGFCFFTSGWTFTAFFLINPILCRRWSLVSCKSEPFSFPPKLDSDVYDEDGNSLSSLDYDREQMDVRSPSSIADDLYSLYYPEKRWLDSHYFLFFVEKHQCRTPSITL